MKTVEERTAEKWLTLLLDDVEAGEDVVITRDGAPLACLQRTADVAHVAQQVRDERQEETRAAMLRIRERAQNLGLQFDLDTFKAWRDEGKS